MNEHRPVEASQKEEDPVCSTISELFARIGDKWTIHTIRALGEGPMRFNALRRTVGEISQKMMSATLRRLERDGFVTRTVTPSTPPQVEYALTELGQDLLRPVCALASWTIENAKRIDAARQHYDRQNGISAE